MTVRCQGCGAAKGDSCLNPATLAPFRNPYIVHTSRLAVTSKTARRGLKVNGVLVGDPERTPSPRRKPRRRSPSPKPIVKPDVRVRARAALARWRVEGQQRRGLT